jgi:hypothetical protein
MPRIRFSTLVVLALVGWLAGTPYGRGVAGAAVDRAFNLMQRANDRAQYKNVPHYLQHLGWLQEHSSFLTTGGYMFATTEKLPDGVWHTTDYISWRPSERSGYVIVTNTRSGATAEMKIIGRNKGLAEAGEEFIRNSPNPHLFQPLPR